MSADGGVRPPVGGTTEPEKPRPGGDAAGLGTTPSPAAKPGLDEPRVRWLIGAEHALAATTRLLDDAEDRLTAVRAAFAALADEIDGDHLIFAARAAQRIRQTLNEEQP